jgi:acetylglutamate synthase
VFILSSEKRLESDFRLSFCSSIILVSLFMVVFIAPVFISHPIHLLPSLCATAQVVPLHIKQSITKSQGLDDALMIFSNNSSGFWVG